MYYTRLWLQANERYEKRVGMMKALRLRVESLMITDLLNLFAHSETEEASTHLLKAAS